MFRRMPPPPHFHDPSQPRSAARRHSARAIEEARQVPRPSLQVDNHLSCCSITAFTRPTHTRADGRAVACLVICQIPRENYPTSEVHRESGGFKTGVGGSHLPPVPPRALCAARAALVPARVGTKSIG